jgi:hypothetical protein
VADFQADATGYYSLVIAPNSPTLIIIELQFDGMFNNMYGFMFKTVTSETLSSDKILYLVTPGSMWSGTVVDANGAPVDSVTISGLSADVGYNLNNIFRSKTEYFGFNVVTSATGEFSVLVSELDLYNVTFTPPTGSVLPIQSRDLTFKPTSQQTIVLQTSLPSASPSQAPKNPTVVFVVLQVSQVIIDEQINMRVCTYKHI